MAPVSPNRMLSEWRMSVMCRIDPASLNYVVWDGSLTTGALTIGLVSQGTAAAASAPWPVTSGFSMAGYDYVTFTPASTTDTYVFKTGGSGGTTVNTITITYTDSTKTVLSTVAKT